MKALIALIVPAVLMVLSTPTHAATEVDAVVEQPRPFGHVVGDVITQRVLLVHDGHAIEPRALQATRVGVWFERRPARIERGADGRRWLLVEHQIINAPRDQAIARLPSLNIQSAAGDVVLKVPAWSLTVQALAAPPDSSAADAAVALRPDRPVAAVPIDALRQRTLAWAAASAFALLAWAAWWHWRNHQAARQRPFARALRELASVDQHAPRAWQLMHQAFDQSAGQVTRIATLQTLFGRRPELAEQRASIEDFYAQSAQRFFGVQAVAEPLALRPLARVLRGIERRYER
jgi:mxaA protein